MKRAAAESATPGKASQGATRRGILRAACDLALTQGLAAITHRAVAEAAGVSLALIRYHYSSKADLIDAIVADLLAATEAGLVADTASLTTRSLTRDDLQEILFLAHLRALTEARDLAIFWSELLLLSSQDERYASFAVRWRKAHLAFLTTVLHQAKIPEADKRARIVLEYLMGERLRELTVAVGLPQLQAARARLSRFIALLDHPADSAVALVAMGLGRGSPP